MDSLSLNNPLVASGLVGSSLVAIAYADAKFNNKDRDRDTYVKLFAITFAITFAIMYFGGGTKGLSKLAGSMKGGGSVMENPVSEVVENVAREIDASLPEF